MFAQGLLVGAEAITFSEERKSFALSQKVKVQLPEWKFKDNVQIVAFVADDGMAILPKPGSLTDSDIVEFCAAKYAGKVILDMGDVEKKYQAFSCDDVVGLNQYLDIQNLAGARFLGASVDVDDLLCIDSDNKLFREDEVIAFKNSEEFYYGKIAYFDEKSLLWIIDTGVAKKLLINSSDVFKFVI
jgi:hypothetical protein